MKTLQTLFICLLIATLSGCAVEYSKSLKSKKKEVYKPFKVEKDSRTKRTPDVH